MKSGIKNIGDKVDTLTVSRQETKDEGEFRKLINKVNETVNYKLRKRYFIEGIVLISLKV